MSKTFIIAEAGVNHNGSLEIAKKLVDVAADAGCDAVLCRINSYKRKVILSTGMSTLDEIKIALEILRDCETAVLHCTTEYPCPYKEVNLRVLQTLKQELQVEVGYSDHTNGIEIPIAAVARGATIIEKHFTLDKNMKGPDHKASLEPNELRQMVSAIRHVEDAISGDGTKRPTESEIKNIDIVRKSIVAKCAIRYGEVFTDDNITTKRPATGLSPMLWDSVLGKQATHDYNEDDMIDERI